jgi:DNA-binding response OmpR family regulator
VVDDEIDTLNLLRTILDISGFDPITTLNSVDAMTLAEVEKPDVVLLDIMMPKLDGFALCKMMRLHPATKDLPIIFVTAYSALDIEDRRDEAGADQIVHKPIDIDILIKTIESAIELRSGNHKEETTPPAASPTAKVPVSESKPPDPPKQEPASVEKSDEQLST